MRLFAVLLILASLSAASALEYNISVPEEVKTGEWFDVNISAVSETSLNLTVYSYVYNGFNCVGQGWITNQENISLSAGELQEIVLKDLVKHGTESGSYNIRVKLKFGNETLNETYTLRVVEQTRFEPTYLYIGLIVVSLAGLYLVLKKG